ncbi:MAG: DUF2182 domain-containing protein [Pseudomonadota bacterium]
MQTETKRDRQILIAALVTIILLSWLFLLAGAGMSMSALEMTRMEMMQFHRVLSGQAPMAEGGMATRTPAWSFFHGVVMFFMWWIMMIAMMLPTATPTALHFTAHARNRAPEGSVLPSAFWFVFAYLSVWAGFSLAAVLVQWGLQSATLLSPMLVSSSLSLDGFLLLAAGLYQFLPLQRQALRFCRSCKDTMPSRWRDGRGGAFMMGLEEGLQCLTLCAPLMLLLFVAGVMNVYWIVALSLLVFIQKHRPNGLLLGHIIGVVLIIWGAWVLIAELF